ncbi:MULTISPECIES: DUF4136 domain-containing protein [Pseudomonas]|uniref:DUF4136 domain-containing protein n=1 Tax=Pseudomonas lutea TaxID=243924 RepID=A0A9X8QI66_9PSED|nr:MULTISPECIES: DUF4136 domain-containing protein [Pseudomonas]SEP94219.1 protein of unknown function [Pseudomonas lutea]
MRRLFACVVISLGLTACQSQNPYIASALPELAAPAPAVPARIDPSSYPAAPVDYGHYRSWAWSPEGIRASGDSSQSMDTSTLQEAISAQLDQRGLRPAPTGTRPDLYVSATVRQEQRVVYDTDYYGGGVGYGGGYPYGYDRWGTYGGTGYSQTRPRYYQVQVLSIELIDSQSRKRIWSGSAEERGGNDQSARAQAIREAARRALEQYPPH